MMSVLKPFRENPALLVLAGILLLGSTPAHAAISQPNTFNKVSVAAPNSAVSLETSAILSQASAIAFEGAKSLETFQRTLSGDPKANVLQNSKLAISFIKASRPSGKNALPADQDVLDEPWQISSTAGTTNEDGLIIPHIGPTDEDDTDHGPRRGIDIDSPTSADKNLLRLLKPVANGVLSSPFGFRWGRPHQGMDLSAPYGSSIVAAEAGKVIYSGWESGYGNFIAIDHGHGLQTHYAHCAKLLVHVGERVSKGETIGKVGTTGHSTGPHVHFEVIANGVHKNPVRYINHSMTILQALR